MVSDKALVSTFLTMNILVVLSAALWFVGLSFLTTFDTVVMWGAVLAMAAIVMVVVFVFLRFMDLLLEQGDEDPIAEVFDDMVLKMSFSIALLFYVASALFTITMLVMSLI